jgi:hypothetical protein
VYAAGTKATAVRTLAIRAMAELGLDIFGQQTSLSSAGMLPRSLG